MKQGRMSTRIKNWEWKKNEPFFRKWEEVDLSLNPQTRNESQNSQIMGLELSPWQQLGDK